MASIIMLTIYGTLVLGVFLTWAGYFWAKPWMLLTGVFLTAGVVPIMGQISTRFFF